MDLFLAIYMVFVFILGYFVMTKLDRFIEQPEFLSDIKNTHFNQKYYILIFGYSVIAKNLMDLLIRQQLDFIVINSEDQLDKSLMYSHLYAISNSDYSNLTISLIAKKSLGIKQIISVCNCIENKPIYDQNNIPFLQLNEDAAEQLFMSFFAAMNQVTLYDE